jgi:hypothetical protein
VPSVDILANTRQAQSNVKDLSKAMDGVADSLDDVAADASRNGEKVERSFREMVTAAKKVDDAVDKIGSTSKRSVNEASESFDEFKSEANSTAKESAASFDGSAESIVGSFQEIAANAFSGFGPLGTVAGLGLAAGIGLGTAAITQADEARQRLQENAGQLANAYIDAGTTALDAMTIAGRTAEILTDPEQRKGAEELRQLIGIDLPTAARALAGDQNALALANKLAADATAENVRLDEQQLAASSKRKSATSDAILQNEKIIEGTRRLNEVNDLATQQFNDQQAALLGLVRDAGTASEEVDGLGNRLLTLPDTTQVLIDAKTGQATTDVSKFKGDLNGVADTIATATLAIDDTAVRNYRPPRVTIQGDLVLANGFNRRALIQ